MSARLPFQAASRSALLASSCLLFTAGAASAQQAAGTLYVTSSTYAGNASTVTIGQPLPINPTKNAIANGTYPTVFNNDSVDANFGITSPIELSALPVAADGTVGVPARVDVTQKTKIVTSFPSKSELGVQLSTDGTALTFTGYRAAINALDISNTNTLMHVDTTNNDIAPSTFRTVIQFNLATGTFSTTDTTAYSGNNMRGAVLAANVNGTGQNEYLLTGNAGNGSGTEPTFLVNDTGVQAVLQGAGPATTTIGVQYGTAGSSTGFEYGFSVASVGYTADKSGKDDNFRGLTVFNNTMYVTKGSGSNGIDTVYKVLGGGAAATLPTAANAANTTVTILPGFPTGLASKIVSGDPKTAFFPFGIWFANANTLYVADEGSQDLVPEANAGLQKWIFNGSTWTLAYTLQNGLNLDKSYTVPGYPAQYAPAVTGLRHLTGAVSGNTVVLYASTATISSLADPGADPNAVVRIVDQLDATTLPAGESFTTVIKPYPRQVNRGVRFIPASAP